MMFKTISDIKEDLFDEYNKEYVVLSSFNKVNTKNIYDIDIAEGSIFISFVPAKSFNNLVAKSIATNKKISAKKLQKLLKKKGVAYNLMFANNLIRLTTMDNETIYHEVPIMKDPEIDENRHLFEVLGYRMGASFEYQ